MRPCRWTVATLAGVALIGLAAAGCGGGDDRRLGDVRALPESSCPTPPVYDGPGDPKYLVASDLPLQDPMRPQAAQMGKAIEFVLRQRRFIAGDKRVAYQACDDSTAQAQSWDSARCTANANAYAANTAVVGIIGTYDSGCAKYVIPILNAKAVAMVSPTNTYVGLTQGGPVAPGEPDIYYPSGRRNYARVIAADNVQGPALAAFARRDLKLMRVFVLNDGQRYGAGIADGFASAAQKLGLAIAGTRTWNPRASDYRALATAIERTGADGVVVSGIVDNNGAKLLKDLRAVLGGSFAILAPDGFTPVESVAREAGGAAEGMHVSIPGPPVDRLTDRGTAFVNAFGPTVGGTAKVSADAVYAAQAAEVLLDAIAASDGSRASVAQRLLAADVNAGIMGSFTIDENGDPTPGAVGIYRVANGKRTTATVLTPDPSLVPTG
jgi:branched-chain amino acid transport system substrate-binding protein